MASKKNGKKSAEMISPMYENSGRTNGTVAGPTSGIAPADPLGYMSSKTHQGSNPPKGSLSDRGMNAPTERSQAQ